MKKYYQIPTDFANVYSLVYCETPEDFAALPKGAERITRKEAIRLCRGEVWRRKYDRSASGYAPTVVHPAAPVTPDTYSEHSFIRNHIFER